MTNVLVTGAAGFIGSQLAERCLGHGHAVLGIDSFTPYYDPELKRANVAAIGTHESWTFLEGDLVELDLVSLLDGIDTSLARFAAGARPEVATAIASFITSADSARAALDLRHSAGVVRFLARAVQAAAG